MGNTASILTCYNCKLVGGEEADPSSYRGCVGKPRKRGDSGSRRECPRLQKEGCSLPATPPVLSGCAVQQQSQLPSVAQACPATVGEMSVPLP
jgi:hypothetical protein